MKRLILFILLLFSITTFSQNKKTEGFQLNKNTFYFEVGGLSLKPFSINYDRVLFTSKNIYFNATIGFGFPNKKSNINQYSIPFYFNLTTGLNKKNHFELGFGITYSNSQYINNKEEIMYGGLKLGYKYQSKSRLFFKAGLNIFDRLHVFEDEKKNSFDFEDLKLIGNIFNISLGYSF